MHQSYFEYLQFKALHDRLQQQQRASFDLQSLQNRVNTHQPQFAPTNIMPNIIQYPPTTSMPNSIHTNPIHGMHSDAFINDTMMTNNANNTSVTSVCNTVRSKRIAIQETPGLFAESKLINSTYQFNIQFIDTDGAFKNVEIPYIAMKCEKHIKEWMNIDLNKNNNRMDILNIAQNPSIRSRFVGLMKRLDAQIRQILQVQRDRQQLELDRKQLDRKQFEFESKSKVKTNPRKRKRSVSDISDVSEDDALYDTVESESSDGDDDEQGLEAAKQELKRFILKDKPERMTAAIFLSRCKKLKKMELYKHYKAITQHWDAENSPDPSFYFVRKGGHGRQLIWTNEPRKQYRKRRKTNTTTPRSHDNVQSHPRRARPKNTLQKKKEEMQSYDNEERDSESETTNEMQPNNTAHAMSAIHSNEKQNIQMNTVIDSEKTKKGKECAFPATEPIDIVDPQTNSDKPDTQTKIKILPKEQMDLANSIANVTDAKENKDEPQSAE